MDGVDFLNDPDIKSRIISHIQTLSNTDLDERIKENIEKKYEYIVSVVFQSAMHNFAIEQAFNVSKKKTLPDDYICRIDVNDFAIGRQKEIINVNTNSGSYNNGYMNYISSVVPDVGRRHTILISHIACQIILSMQSAFDDDTIRSAQNEMAMNKTFVE